MDFVEALSAVGVAFGMGIVAAGVCSWVSDLIQYVWKRRKTDG